LHAMHRHQKARGMAGLCLGGGNAVVMGVELI
jgi:acetyl-CoA acetyltransferase